MSDGIRLEVKGLAELDAVLEALPFEMQRRALRHALRRGAGLVRDRMVQLAPRDEGDLAANIGISVREGGAILARAGRSRSQYAATSTGTHGGSLVAWIGPMKRVYYGWFQELGTAHHPPQPFMRPALDETASQVLAVFRTELARAIDLAFRRLARLARRAA